MMNAKQQATRHDERKNLGTARNSIIGFRDNIKTYISHNKGAFWELIRAPEHDMKNKPSKCFLEDGCSLHFNIYNRLGDAYHAPPYSSENAVGIVMAVGNTGKVLKKNRGDKKSTYLSRDGGGSFWEIAKVPLIYEFGDHGGILVAAANTEATTQIRYSWNEGLHWTKLQISDIPIYVDNIIVEPKATSLQFVLYGAYEENLSEKDEDLDDPEPEKKL